MFTKKIQDLELTDIQSLIDNGVSESQTLDYKVDGLGLSTDGEKKEFLADVVAFANTHGGHIIYGVSEEKGVAKEIVGIEIDDLDKLKLKIESILREGLEPRIFCEMHEVEIEAGRYIFVLTIKDGFNKPHRVRYKNSNKFYMRHSTGNYLLSLTQTKDLFLMNDSLEKKITDFKYSRIGAIQVNDLISPLPDGFKLVVHVIPLNPNFTINLLETDALRSIFRPWRTGGGWNHRITIDGFLLHAQESFLQLYKNGSIESVVLHNQDKIYHGFSDKYILNHVMEILSGLNHIGVTMPFYLSLCILGAKGSQLRETGFSENNYLYEKDVLDAGNVVLYNTDNIEIQLKPLFDTIWNAFGYPQSWNYDQNGNWIGEKK